MLSEKEMIVVLEDLNAKFDILLETLLDMRSKIHEIGCTKGDMREIKADLHDIKVALGIAT